MTRPKRWDKATEKMREALGELQELRDEYQDWLDTPPEGLEEGPTAEKLEAVCDLDLETVEDILGEVENANLPRGFGRD